MAEEFWDEGMYSDPDEGYEPTVEEEMAIEEETLYQDGPIENYGPFEDEWAPYQAASPMPEDTSPPLTPVFSPPMDPLDEVEDIYDIGRMESFPESEDPVGDWTVAVRARGNYVDPETGDEMTPEGQHVADAPGYVRSFATAQHPWSTPPDARFEEKLDWMIRSYYDERVIDEGYTPWTAWVEAVRAEGGGMGLDAEGNVVIPETGQIIARAPSEVAGYAQSHYESGTMDPKLAAGRLTPEWEAWQHHRSAPVAGKSGVQQWQAEVYGRGHYMDVFGNERDRDGRIVAYAPSEVRDKMDDWVRGGKGRPDPRLVPATDPTGGVTIMPPRTPPAERPGGTGEAPPADAPVIPEQPWPRAPSLPPGVTPRVRAPQMRWNPDSGWYDIAS